MTSKQNKTSLDALSGPWGGYWMQGKLKGIMTLELSFRSGQITGTGSDQAGAFMLHGTYDDVGGVELVKQYALYPLLYRGVWSGRILRGKWLIGTTCGGNFRMDPGAPTY